MAHVAGRSFSSVKLFALYLRGTWNPVYIGFRCRPAAEEFMAVLIDAIDVKKRTLFEIDNTPFSCLEAEVNTPTARGGQTLVRLKIRNLLTNAVFERTFKAGEKFKEPDLQLVPASYPPQRMPAIPSRWDYRCT